MINSLYQELKERKVIRTVVIYIASGWGILEAIDFFSNRYHWQDFIFEMVLVLMISGLPFSIIKSWFHSQGDVQKVSRRELILITINILLAITLVTYTMVFREAKSTPVIMDKSIAVLPFVNMSNDPDQEYFSDGLSEELLNLLSKISELKVIGRTSSFSFKGKNEDLRTIAEKLGVAHLLEGSVRKDGNTIRVTAQLIKATDGSHLWSETYDRDLTGIFKLQDEIAQAVVKQLKLKLLKTPGVATGNIEAYNLILQGNYFYDKLDKDNVAKAVDFYNQALVIDSTDAHAWGKLSQAISRQAWQNDIDQKSGYEKVRKIALKVISLDSTNAIGYFKLADVKLYHDFDWHGAEKTYQKALSFEPDNATVLYGVSSLYMATGRWEESIRAINKSIELDPLKPINYLVLGNIQTHAGRMKLFQIIKRPWN